MTKGRAVVLLCAMLADGGGAFGQVNLLDADPGSPTFNNPSFENPDVAFVGVNADKWTTTGPKQLVDVPGVGQVKVVSGAVIFENPAPAQSGRIEGADGTQLAYIFANPVNDVDTNQPMDHAFTQILPLTFEAGTQYQLAIGVARAQAQPPPAAELVLSLFAADNPALALALEAVSNNGEINGTSLTDFFAVTNAIAGDAVGKQIGIRIETRNGQAGAEGQFDFDNVRLTIVPEPTGIALFGAASLLLVGRRRRRSR